MRHRRIAVHEMKADGELPADTKAAVIEVS
jgi:hypothetical protein